MANNVVNLSSYLWIITEFNHLTKDTDLWVIVSSIATGLSAVATSVICYFSWRDSSIWKKERLIGEQCNLINILTDYLTFLDDLRLFASKREYSGSISDNKLHKLDNFHKDFIRSYNTFRLIFNYQSSKKKQKKFCNKYEKKMQNIKSKYYMAFESLTEHDEKLIMEFEKLILDFIELVGDIRFFK